MCVGKITHRPRQDKSCEQGDKEQPQGYSRQLCHLDRQTHFLLTPHFQQYYKTGLLLIVNTQVQVEVEGGENVAVPKWEFQLSDDKILWKTKPRGLDLLIRIYSRCARLLLKFP